MERRSRIEVFEGGFVEHFEYVDDTDEADSAEDHGIRLIGPAADDEPDDWPDQTG
jgi:hypothetical protein